MSGTSIEKQVENFLQNASSVSEQDIQQLARLLLEKGEEDIIFLLLQISQSIQALENQQHESESPSTPSGMVPPYQKKPAKTKRKKKVGAKFGHPGSRRAQPERIDRQ